MPKSIKDLSKQEKLRWYALIETIDFISDECEKKNIKFENLDLKPSAIYDYMNHIHDKLAQKIPHEREKILIDIEGVDVNVKKANKSLARR